MILYDFQDNAVNECVKNLKCGKNVLLYSPTGSGKTVMSAAVSKHFSSVLFIVNKKILLSQSYTEFKKLDVNFDVSVFHNSIKYTIDGDLMSTDLESHILISLVETLNNNLIDKNPVLIIFDEAHKCTSEIYQLIRKYYNN